MASKRTQCLAFVYWTFLDLLGSCALLTMESSASHSLALTTGSAEGRRDLYNPFTSIDF